MSFKWNFQFIQKGGCFSDNGQITVAAHDNADFFHVFLLFYVFALVSQ